MPQDIISLSLNPQIRTRFIGKPARTCRTCGSDRFHVTERGGMFCATCAPAPSPALTLVATLSPGGAVLWQDADGSGAVAPSLAVSTQAPAPVSWPVSERAAPYATIQPSAAILFVSTRLEWLVVPHRPNRDPAPADIEIAGHPARALTRDYFAWLAARVRQLPEPHFTEGLAALREIAAEAHRLFILPAWALDPSEWPQARPSYLGPVPRIDPFTTAPAPPDNIGPATDAESWGETGGHDGRAACGIPHGPGWHLAVLGMLVILGRDVSTPGMIWPAGTMATVTGGGLSGNGESILNLSRGGRLIISGLASEAISEVLEF